MNDAVYESISRYVNEKIELWKRTNVAIRQKSENEGGDVALYCDGLADRTDDLIKELESVVWLLDFEHRHNC